MCSNGAYSSTQYCRLKSHVTSPTWYVCNFAAPTTAERARHFRDGHFLVFLAPSLVIFIFFFEVYCLFYLFLYFLHVSSVSVAVLFSLGYAYHVTTTGSLEDESKCDNKSNYLN